MAQSSIMLGMIVAAVIVALLTIAILAFTQGGRVRAYFVHALAAWVLYERDADFAAAVVSCLTLAEPDRGRAIAFLYFLTQASTPASFSLLFLSADHRQRSPLQTLPGADAHEAIQERAGALLQRLLEDRTQSASLPQLRQELRELSPIHDSSLGTSWTNYRAFPTLNRPSVTRIVRFLESTR